MKVAIFGTGVFADLVYSKITRKGLDKVSFFITDTPKGDTHIGVSHISTEEFLSSELSRTTAVFVAIGPSRMNRGRQLVYERLKEGGCFFYNVISEKAVCHWAVPCSIYIGDFVSIDSSVKLGAGVTVWDGAVISNNAIIENFVYISPLAGIGAYCQLGTNSLIGMGAVIKPKVKVAASTLVGANAYISEDTIEYGVYGSPKSNFLGQVSDRIDISK